ncbi:MAG: hypothetical protein MUO53_05155 [Maribacter sp.]|nr:hypothetical protein [Maribacter sp.]
MTDKTKSKRAKRKIFIESILIFFIAVAPFLYKVYDYLPENPEETISFLGITIGNNGFADLSTYAWFMMGKIIPLYLMIIWFLTSKNWWYHIILIPIAMYAFQIFEVLYSHDDDIDTENIWWLIPICMIVVPFVYFIRIKLYDKYVHGIDLEAMEAELESLKQKQGYKKPIQQDILEANHDENDTDYSNLLNTKLPNNRLENLYRQLQHLLQNWLHLKF